MTLDAWIGVGGACSALAVWIYIDESRKRKQEREEIQRMAANYLNNMPTANLTLKDWHPPTLEPPHAPDDSKRLP